MRQAGRFLPEYRKIRETYNLVEICKDPELCAKVSTLPVETLDVDAAILFSDIILPLEGMGVNFEIQEGIGPVIRKPVQNFENANALNPLQPKADLQYILEAISATKKD